MDTDFTQECIRSLNDEAGRHFADDGIVFSRGIAALPDKERAEILDRVRTFEDLTPDDDPPGEYDYGSFDYNGHRICWKAYLDRYASAYGRPDPADRYVHRLLRITLAGEY